MNPTLADIQLLIEYLATRINAPKELLPTYGHSVDFGHPHIEVDSKGQLCYVIVERGEELRRDCAANSNDLLFRVFDAVTFSMAVDFEVNNRIETEDSRRQIFAKQIELLSMLDKKWAGRKEKEQLLILNEYPFSD